MELSLLSVASLDCLTGLFLCFDLLLCVARLKAVTLYWDAPLSKAKCPGISVSRTESSGVVSLPRFCLSSSRSLGHGLLLGQRSRMNLSSHYIRPLLHQDHGNPRTQLSRHRHYGDPRSQMARMSPANRAVKFPH